MTFVLFVVNFKISNLTSPLKELLNEMFLKVFFLPQQYFPQKNSFTGD